MKYVIFIPLVSLLFLFACNKENVPDYPTEQTILADSIHIYYFKVPGDSVLSARQYYKYDVNGNINKYIYTYYTTDLHPETHSVKMESVYNDAGYLLSQRNFDLDPKTKKWNLRMETINTYWNNCFLLKEEYFSYDSDTKQIQTSLRTEYFLNASGACDSLLNYQMLNPQNYWTLTEKDCFLYDTLGNEYLSYGYEFTTSDKTYKLKSKKLSFYDSENRPALHEFYSLDIDRVTWKLNSKYEFTWDAGGRSLSQKYFTTNNGSEWFISYQLEYTYNNKGILISSERYGYNYRKPFFQLETKVDYLLNNEDAVIYAFHRDWRESISPKLYSSVYFNSTHSVKIQAASSGEIIDLKILDKAFVKKQNVNFMTHESF